MVKIFGRVVASENGEILAEITGLDPYGRFHSDIVWEDVTAEVEAGVEVGARREGRGMPFVNPPSTAPAEPVVGE